MAYARQTDRSSTDGRALRLEQAYIAAHKRLVQFYRTKNTPHPHSYQKAVEYFGTDQVCLEGNKKKLLRLAGRPFLV